MRKTILTTLTVVITLGVIFGGAYFVIDTINVCQRYETVYWRARHLGYTEEQAERIVEIQKDYDLGG